MICVKIGEKYSSSYVNNLYNMCRKNITENFNFLCYTDDASDIRSEVSVVPYVNHYLDVITHNKLFLFSREFDKQIPPGPRVFFDLDLIIKTNVDHIVTNNKNDITLIRAEWRPEDPRDTMDFCHMFNSSCMTWNTNKRTLNVWEHYIQDPERYTFLYEMGMDPFLSYEQNNIGVRINFFPRYTFYSHLSGVSFNDNLEKSGDGDIYIEADHRDVIELIPIVLLNGPTTHDQYESFSKFYED